jgi:multiple sugar transport system permease protein
VLLRFDRDPEARPVNPSWPVWIVNGLLAGLAAARPVSRCCGCVGVGDGPAGASSTLPTPCSRAAHIRQLRQLFGSIGMGRYFSTAWRSRCSATLISVSFNVMAGYAFAKLRFRGRDAIFKGCSARS